MDMPITVIIVLFVAVVVGGAILLFSRQSLDASQQQLMEQLRKDPTTADKVVQLDAATQSSIMNLAQECGKNRAGATESTLCYAVFANTMPDFAAMNGAALGNGVTLNTSGVSGTPKAIRITLIPPNRVTIVG